MHPCAACPASPQPLDDDRQSAGIEELFHQVFARGHQVDDSRHIAATAIPVIKRQIDANPARQSPAGGSPHWSSHRWRHWCGSHFRTPALVIMSDGFRSSLTIWTMRRPVSCAITRRRLSTAGMAALPDSAMPSASAMDAMVEAVPIVLQVPGRAGHRSFGLEKLLLRHLTGLRPLRKISTDACPSRPVRRETAVEHRPAGDHDRRQVRDAAPISRLGVVLSQPTSSTTPSIGLAANGFLDRQARRLRYIIAVGRKALSDARKHGNLQRKATGLVDAVSSPVRPDRADGRCTASARTRYCRMPITGRPSNRSCG